MAKERLDVLLYGRGLARSREEAKRLIMAGLVYVDGQKEDKAGMKYAEDASIEVRGRLIPYVSRGGLKLEKAIRAFSLDLSGKTCIDVGASTGGFTDCMLQNGAAKVYAVDVGYGQFDWKLRNDTRVDLREKTNIRYALPSDYPEQMDFAGIDVSFISLTKVLPAVAGLLKDGAQIAALIKPQFEAGREKVGKKGVVRDPAVHREVIGKVLSFASELPLAVRGLAFSPIRGPEGNIEYLALFAKENGSIACDISAVVEDAHASLDR